MDEEFYIDGITSESFIVLEYLEAYVNLMDYAVFNHPTEL
jgi:hypothetical protein